MSNAIVSPKSTSSEADTSSSSEEIIIADTLDIIKEETETKELQLSNVIEDQNEKKEEEAKQRKKELENMALLAHLREQRNKELFFKQEFEAFMKQAQETIQSKYEHLFKLGQTKPELERLLRYKTIYDCTSAKEHYMYFEKIYNQNRMDIHKRPLNVEWIANGDVCIQFGDGIKSASKAMEEKKAQVCIMVSNIYRIAYSLQIQAEKTMQGLDPKFQTETTKKDLIRTKILLLHLYRIFYYLNDSIDRPRIAEIVNDLEKTLGVSRNSIKEYTDANKDPSYQGQGQVGNGLAGIFNMATGFMEKMGIKPPPGMVAPTEGELTQVISKVFNNESTQGAIQSMLGMLQNCGNMETVIQEVVKGVQNPEMLNQVKLAAEKEAEILRPNGNTPNL
jgi:hypothetical protein